MITPQLGLVPLGEDPDSHLFEFAHLGSGSIPTRDEKGHLVPEEDAAVVLVLIPGGTFQMGAQKEDKDGPNYDPEAEDDESPVHEVTLSPFFLSKYECTQAEWKAMTGGLDPSRYKAGQTLGDKPLTAEEPGRAGLLGGLRPLALAKPPRAPHGGPVGVRVPGGDGHALDHGPGCREAGRGRQHRRRLAEGARVGDAGQ